MTKAVGYPRNFKGIELTAKELEYAKSYKGSGYASLNRALNAQKDGDPIPNGFTEFVMNLDSAISKSRAMSESTIYRGMNVPEFRKLKVGDEIVLKAYSSWSYDPEVSKRFAGGSSGSVMFETIIPGDFPGLRIEMDKVTHGGGMNGSEFEILLPRNLPVKVLEVHNKHGMPYFVVEIAGRGHVVDANGEPEVDVEKAFKEMTPPPKTLSLGEILAAHAAKFKK